MCKEKLRELQLLSKEKIQGYLIDMYEQLIRESKRS